MFIRHKHVFFLLQFSASDGIQSLEGQRVRFDANGDIINQDFTVYNYNNRLSSTNFVFEEVRKEFIFKVFFPLIHLNSRVLVFFFKFPVGLI